MTIQIRRDTAANWTSGNPTPAAGQPCYETDTAKLKVGDGSTAWASLPYFGGSGTGTVTSVALSGGTTGLSASGSPVTTAGTITLGGTLVVANGGTGATTLTGYVKGSGTSALTASSTIPATDLTGTLAAGQFPALTGDVTTTAGSLAATIANSAVTLAKMADMATASVIYRKTAGTGAPEVQALATLKTDLGLTGTNSGDQTITLTGDVTGSGTGSFAATIGSATVTLGKMANLAANSIIGNNTGSPATPLALTASQVKTLLAITNSDVSGLGTLATQSGTFSGTHSGTSSGTNTGDQTITLTGDVTGSGTGSFAATLATVNSNVGSFGSSSLVPVITVNGKGLITAVSTASVAGGSGFDEGLGIAARMCAYTL